MNKTVKGPTHVRRQISKKEDLFLRYLPGGRFNLTLETTEQQLKIAHFLKLYTHRVSQPLHKKFKDQVAVGEHPSVVVEGRLYDMFVLLQVAGELLDQAVEQANTSKAAYAVLDREPLPETTEAIAGQVIVIPAPKPKMFAGMTQSEFEQLFA